MAKIWNMASLRHRQTPRRYKPCQPVGEVRKVLHGNGPATCSGCGFHVCSCEKPSAKSMTLQTACGPLTVVSHPNHFGPPMFIDPTTQWLGKKAKAVEVQPMMHGFNCAKHGSSGWSTKAGDGCVLCKIDDKAAAVLADMQPESPVYNSVLEAMKAMRERDQMLMTLKPGYEVPMSRFSPAIDIKPLSPAYLDGIDDLLAMSEAQNEKPR